MKRGVNSQVKIVQVLTSLREGDAIGNDVVAMDEVLRKAGYSCEMMAVTIGDSLLQRATNVDFTRIRKEDLVIFHKATGDALTKHVARLACKKLLIYHNITPGPSYSTEQATDVMVRSNVIDASDRYYRNRQRSVRCIDR